MPLATFLYFSGLILFAKAVSSESGKPLFITALFFTSLMGMSTSERFVTFPFMLILYDFFFVSKHKVTSVLRNYRVHVPVILTLSYLAYLMMSYQYQDMILGAKKATTVEYLMTQFNVHWTYLRLLVFPMNLRIDYDYPVSRTLFELPTMLSFIGYSMLWAAGFFLWKKRPVISFGILWFMVILAPVSSIIPLINMMFEHRLYFPSIGIITVIVTLIFAASDKFGEGSNISGRTIICVLSVIVTVLTGVTYVRNMVWKDAVTLWEDTVSKSPGKAKSHNNLGRAYKK
jgi:hypothetical protein